MHLLHLVAMPFPLVINLFQEMVVCLDKRPEKSQWGIIMDLWFGTNPPGGTQT